MANCAERSHPVLRCTQATSDPASPPGLAALCVSTQWSLAYHNHPYPLIYVPRTRKPLSLLSILATSSPSSHLLYIHLAPLSRRHSILLTRNWFSLAYSLFSLRPLC